MKFHLALPSGRPLMALALMLSLGGCGGGGGSMPEPSTAPSPSPVPAPAPAPPPGGGFNGNIVLGAPTMSSIEAKLYSDDQAGSVQLRALKADGSGAEISSALAALVPGQVTSLTVGNLSPDTAYRYRVLYTPSGGGTTQAGPDYAFRTSRSAGASFSFTIQADSHLDENSSLTVYERTLDNVLADAPDFHIDLGDTFMTEKHSDPLVALVQMAPDAQTVQRRYRYERANFGRMSHSVPLFLVNGNHEGELGWLDTSVANALPVWATQARQSYFANPSPGIFYGGDKLPEPFVGLRAAWYCWTWGDALFIVLDPFWHSLGQASKDGWNLSLGERQYRWLADTLASSKARYKFVFVHNLVGGLDGQMRGGVEAAPFYEWGGKNPDGSEGFATHRPGWALPIHALLVRHGVTAVFHGHDHLYAKQLLDGVIYQTVPQPSALNNSNGATLARDYHYSSGTILSSSGHLRVTVGPSGVLSEYVRSWLPKDENANRRNRQVDDRWTVSQP